MDLDEEEYADLIQEMLVAEYGTENVNRGVYLGDVNRYVDFVVEAWPVDMAIEVESNFESVFKGVGQVLVYAAEDLDMAPVIIRPPFEDESDALENNRLSRHVAIKEFDPKDWNAEE